MYLFKANCSLSNSNNSKNSFTLIEVLVAIAILSIVVVIFYSTWWLGMKTIRRSNEIAQKYMGARVFMDNLAKELRSAFEFNYRDYQDFVWDANAKRLEFWGVAPDEVPVIYTYPFPIHRYIYYIKKENAHNVIYKRVEPLYVNYPEKYEAVEGPILEGDFDLEINPIYPPGKITTPLPERVIVTLIIEGKYRLEKIIYINGLKKL